ncbi:MAG: type I glyceraldehyde-3-phosphate dehydrogenase, partial [Minisyncoccia bacterium]
VLKISLLPPYNEQLEIVAVNDLGDVQNLAYLVKYDSVYGTLVQDVSVIEREGNPYIKVGDQEILVCSEREPAKLPWGALGIDVVIESTGFFTSTEKSQAHIEAGAKRVVISAPTKDDTPMITPSLNEDGLKNVVITSNASCTTNATNPIVSVIHEALGIEKALLSTVHAYTATQSLVDGMADPSDLRRGRAGAQNIIPSTTGAAKAVSKVIPDLANKFDGVAIRVPVVSGSLIDLTMLVSRDTTIEEINQILTNASESTKWKDILGVTKDPIVSTDILKTSYGSLVALDLTQVVDGDLIKVMAWYDNEWSYTSMLMKHVSSVLALV